MARAVQQIEQEIAALDQVVVAMAQAFYDAYRQYLESLGQAMRRQFILAGYHICTHSYPEQFLSLPLEQRQALQHSLQQLARQGQAELGDCLTPVTPIDPEQPQSPHTSTEPEAADGMVEAEQGDREGEADAGSLWVSHSLPAAEVRDSQILGFTWVEPSEPTSESISDEFISESTVEFSPSESTVQPAPDASATEAEGTNIPNSGTLDSDVLHSPSQPTPEAQPEAQDASFSGGEHLEATPHPESQPESQPESTPPDRPLHPRDILLWQNQLEENLAEVLQRLSHTMNRTLQQADILPSQLPEPILEVATKADLSSETADSPPNLLNLLVEAEGDENLSMTQVVAIRLRLSEIEFGDAPTAAYRAKLRHLMTQLSKLGREYQRKQRERAVAEAEAAWRASWYELES